MIWLRFSLLKLVVPGSQLPGSGHNCTDLLQALQSWVPGLGCSSPSAGHWVFPTGIRAGCCSISKATRSTCDRPGQRLTWRLGSSSRNMKGLPKRRWRTAFMVSFSDLNFSCAKRCWT